MIAWLCLAVVVGIPAAFGVGLCVGADFQHRPSTLSELHALLPDAAVEAVPRADAALDELVIYTGLAVDPADDRGEHLVAWADE